MNRICKSALLATMLFALAGGVVVACGGSADDGDHDHKPGEKHDDTK